EALYDGLYAACGRWDVALVGGDLVRAPVLSLAVTAVGAVTRPVLRSGAQPGQRIVCVGGLGAAATALAQVDAGHEPDPALLAAHRRPSALPAAARALVGAGATAMIDVSDGLGADLGHVCAASGVAAVVEATALPVAPGVLSAIAELTVDI